MALEDLNPAVRVEEILDGADIEPATRLEYFMKKAANEVPKPTGSSDAGKVVTVNEDGDGFELTEPASGGVVYLSLTEDVLDASYADIANAADNGSVVCIKRVRRGATYLSNLCFYGYNSESGKYTAVFGYFNTDGSSGTTIFVSQSETEPMSEGTL